MKIGYVIVGGGIAVLVEVCLYSVCVLLFWLLYLKLLLNFVGRRIGASFY
jgi:hypothetical protein